MYHYTCLDFLYLPPNSEILLLGFLKEAKEEKPIKKFTGKVGK
jgi:hypothetical protein